MKELIEKLQGALDYGERKFIGYTKHQGVLVRTETIQDAITALKQSEWISVEDNAKLRPHERYQVYTNTDEVLIDCWNGFKWRTYNGITHYKIIDLTPPNK